MLNSVSGSDWYSQHQTHANNLSELTNQAPEEVKASNDKLYEDSLSVSGQASAFERVAKHYRVAEINFPEVIRLRQDLFDEGLINISQVNTLTLATQTLPDDKRFDLGVTLRQFGEHDGHWSILKDVSKLEKIVANLHAAQA